MRRKPLTQHPSKSKASVLMPPACFPGHAKSKCYHEDGGRRHCCNSTMNRSITGDDHSHYSSAPPALKAPPTKSKKKETPVGSPGLSNVNKKHLHIHHHTPAKLASSCALWPQRASAACNAISLASRIFEISAQNLSLRYFAETDLVTRLTLSCARDCN